jgi:hypothetical protein
MPVVPSPSPISPEALPWSETHAPKMAPRLRAAFGIPTHLTQAFFIAFHFDPETIVSLDKTYLADHFFCHFFS